MIARILRWLDTIAEGTAEGSDLLFWPPACDVWITSLDPAVVPSDDANTILHGQRLNNTDLEMVAGTVLP
jgi:hypothetical protein